MKKKGDSKKLKTKQQDDLDVVGNLFQGMPQTMEDIDFSLANLNENERMHTQKRNSNINENKKTNSISQSSPSNGKDDSERPMKLQACVETLRKLKQQRELLNKKKFTKMETHRIRYCTTNLKSSLGSQRVMGICKNVITKLRRNNIYEPPLNQQYFSKFNFSFKRNGIILQQCILNILDLYGCLITLFLLFSQTLSIAFSEFEDNKIVEVISILGLLFYCLQIFLNFFLVKKINGVTITKIADIAHQYLHSYFVIDISIVFFTSVTFLATDLLFRGVLLFLTFLKLPYMMDKFSKFQRGIVSSLYYQRYWSLFKIILFNFVFAHFIAIILNLMTKNQSYNWQVAKGISNNPFIQKYIWSYYWATTIMLTVGFGDIIPVSCQEATWMIFVEIISCIAFSYNISCLGSLISNIRAQKEEIQKNRSIFENMSKNSGFSEDLIQKIESYIDQSVIIRNKFNIQEEKEFIQNLPSGFKEQVLCQSNKNMLMKLDFFGSLLDKSIYKLSEKIQRQMYHPDQVLRPFNSTLKVRIFKEGKIGYVCRNKPNWLPVNKISKTKMDHPFLMTIEFLTRKQPNYQIKSLDYSIVHQLSEQALVQALRTVSKDFQYYSFLKDKSKHIVDEFETVPCDLCTTKHTHCDCPKLHYIPLTEHIAHKHLHILKVSKNERTKLFQRNKVFQNALKMIAKNKQGIDLRKEISSPISKCNYKNQIIFMNLMSKKPFNDEKTLKQKQPESQFMDNSGMFQMTNSRMINSTKRESLKQYEDDVWKLAVDVCWNYEIYYPLENSLNLEKNFSLQKRSSNWMQYLN